MQCYDIETLKIISSKLNIPVIACGGAGNFSHFIEAFNETEVSALACASLFHFGDNNPFRARSYLKNAGIQVRKVK